MPREEPNVLPSNMHFADRAQWIRQVGHNFERMKSMLEKIGAPRDVISEATVQIRQINQIADDMTESGDFVHIKPEWDRETVRHLQELEQTLEDNGVIAIDNSPRSKLHVGTEECTDYPEKGANANLSRAASQR